MWRIYNCIANDHDHGLVILAALICLFGSIISFAIFERAQKTTRRQYVWNTILAFTAGTTTWSTHFVAMLAYQQSLPMSFEPVETLLSLVIGVAVIGAGLIMLLEPRKKLGRTIIAGATMAIGTIGLHYVGVTGVVLPGIITFSNDLVIASVALSVGFGILSASYVSKSMNAAARLKAVSMFVLMIVSLHFTGMASIEVELGFAENTEAILSRAGLSILVTVGAASLLGIAAATAFFDYKRSMIAERQANRFRVLADSTLEGLIVFHNNRIDDFNTSARELLGLCPKCCGESIHKIIHPDHLGKLISSAQHAEKQQPVELTIKDIQGHDIISEAACRSIELADGNPGYVLAVRDIRQTKAAQDHAKYISLHDPLTRLPNRKMFNLYAVEAIIEAERKKQKFAVMVIDLDNFKSVNDFYGHEAADDYLASIGELISAELEDSSVIARLGSDEFAILETGLTDVASASSIAERVIKLANNASHILPDNTAVGMSIGISMFPDDGNKIDELIQHAETAMSAAKKNGKNSYLLFSPDMQETMRERRQIETRLRIAVKNNSFTVNFQPIVDSASLQPKSFEALVRWQDTELGFIPPDKFIPIAEETGLIIDIGRQVLKKACLTAKEWPDDIRVAVNLSVVQFEQPGLLETITDILKETGLAANRLDLEITESIVLSNSEKTLEILTKLKSRGIRISMDDFGTGYSSLSYLQRFPFDKLKIDRVFVSDLESDDNNAAIVRAVVAMGKSLNMCVVAEGVERRSQVGRLVSLGCSEIQGYLIAKPMPGDQVMQFLSENIDARDDFAQTISA